MKGTTFREKATSLRAVHTPCLPASSLLTLHGSTQSEQNTLQGLPGQTPTPALHPPHSSDQPWLNVSVPGLTVRIPLRGRGTGPLASARSRLPAPLPRARARNRSTYLARREGRPARHPPHPGAHGPAPTTAAAHQTTLGRWKATGLPLSPAPQAAQPMRRGLVAFRPPIGCGIGPAPSRTGAAAASGGPGAVQAEGLHGERVCGGGVTRLRGAGASGAGGAGLCQHGEAGRAAAEGGPGR